MEYRIFIDRSPNNEPVADSHPCSHSDVVTPLSLVDKCIWRSGILDLGILAIEGSPAGTNLDRSGRSPWGAPGNRHVLPARHSVANSGGAPQLVWRGVQ